MQSHLPIQLRDLGQLVTGEAEAETETKDAKRRGQSTWPHQGQQPQALMGPEGQCRGPAAPGKEILLAFQGVHLPGQQILCKIWWESREQSGQASHY